MNNPLIVDLVQKVKGAYPKELQAYFIQIE